MDNRINDDNEPIDHKTSRSICEAVAQRLKENLRLEPSRPRASPPIFLTWSKNCAGAKTAERGRTGGNGPFWRIVFTTPQHTGCVFRATR